MRCLHYTLFRWVCGAAMVGTLGLSVWAQEVEEEISDRPVIDAAQMPSEMFERLRVATLPVKPLAPDIKPFRVQLPPTVAPPPQEDASGSRVLRVGYEGPVPQGIFERAPWHRLPDGGRIKRIELHSPNATALRIIMTDPGPVEVYAYDPVSQSAFGPYRNPQLSDDGTWWSTIIFGDTIGLEFYLPPDYTTPPPVLPRIVGALYCYARLTDFLPQTGDCHTDITCFPNWANSIEDRAVGFAFNFGGACSGAMMNRFGADFVQLFMTARHCISTQAQANNVIVVWFYRSQNCNAKNPPNFNTLPRNEGALLLKTDAESDWTLLGFYRPSGTDSYIGSDPNALPNGSPVTTVGHPGTFPKRIQFGNKTGDVICFGSASAHAVTNTPGFLGSQGDSGSPVYDSARRVRGTISCGPSNCTTLYAAGRYDVAYPELQWYIVPANPTYVDRAVAGDPGNDGDSERGTASNPFNTVYEGIFCVPANGVVRIKPGNYNERFRVDRPGPIRLERDGASGVVRIGAP